MHALLDLPQSAVNTVIVKWKRLGATTAQLQSGRPHKLKEWDRQGLKRVLRTNHLSLVATLTIEFQTAPGSNVITTVHLELHERDFFGRAAAHKPEITTRNAKCWLDC